MQTIQLDSQEAQTGLAKLRAYQDAQRRNNAERDNYSPAQQAQAVEVKRQLAQVYAHKCIYISYRQAFIAIKVDKPRVKNYAALRELENRFVNAGMRKAESAQGVIYRILKA